MTPFSSIFDKLSRGEVAFPPLVIRPLEQDTTSPASSRSDRIIEVVWDRQPFTFSVETRSQSTPKAIQGAADAADRVARMNPGNQPLVVVPYLSEEQLSALEARGISGIDLSGNGVITVPGKFLVRKTGKPNAYPQSTPLRNVYQGASSLVPRVFFARPQYPSVNEVYAEITRRGGSIVLSTVSKVLKNLQENLIVARDGNVRLVQPDKLLDNLLQNFRPPKVLTRWVGKIAIDEKELIAQVSATATRLGSRAVLTGTWSGLRMAVSGQEPLVSFYCTGAPERLAESMNIQATERFPNVELLWTDDAAVYFDSRMSGGIPMAAPIQCYLEMARGEKRLRDLSEQVRTLLYSHLRQSETP